MTHTLSTGCLLLMALIQAVILLALTPFFTGVSRQIRARMHSRQGPGIWQDYRDVSKLLKRQEVAPASSGLMFRLMPWVLLSSMLVVATTLPLFVRASLFTGGGDLITLIYLLALFRFFFALSGLDPYRHHQQRAGKRLGFACRNAAGATGLWVRLLYRNGQNPL